MIDKKTWGLFKPWLIKFNGNTKNSAESYGTYINNCLDLNVNIFDADGNVRKDLEAFLVEVRYFRTYIDRHRVKSTTDKSDAKSALKSFERFIDWLLEYPEVNTYGDIEHQIQGTPRKEIGLDGKVDDKLKYLKRAENDNHIPEVDSYGLLFDYFRDESLAPEMFYRFGLENSIYADFVDRKSVKEQFETIINLLLGRAKRRRGLKIRKYSGSKEKTQPFLDVYRKVFPAKITIDSNANPTANICDITKCKLYSQSERFNVPSDTLLVLKNYQRSHVLDNRTKNPILFEAAWNIVLTPKVTDPLTGHETLGRWPEEFQALFRIEIHNRFSACIDRFNVFANEWRARLRKAAEETAAEHHDLNDNEKKKFVADFMDQWEPIEMETMKRKQNARR